MEDNEEPMRDQISMKVKILLEEFNDVAPDELPIGLLLYEISNTILIRFLVFPYLTCLIIA